METNMLGCKNFAVVKGIDTVDMECLDILTKGDIADRMQNATNEMRQRAFEFVKNIDNFSMAAEKFEIQIGYNINWTKTYCVLGSPKRFIIAVLNDRNGYVEKEEEFDSEKEVDAYIEKLCARENVDSYKKEYHKISCDMNSGRRELYMIIDCEQTIQ